MSNSTIKTPIPGTFYRRPAPDKPPFKEEGDACVEGNNWVSRGDEELSRN